MAGGLVLLLSQLSYSPADLPEWGMFEPFSDKGDVQGDNWLASGAFWHLYRFSCLELPVGCSL